VSPVRYTRANRIDYVDTLRKQVQKLAQAKELVVHARTVLAHGPVADDELDRALAQARDALEHVATLVEERRRTTQQRINS